MVKKDLKSVPKKRTKKQKQKPLISQKQSVNVKVVNVFPKKIRPPRRPKSTLVRTAGLPQRFTTFETVTNFSSGIPQQNTENFIKPVKPVNISVNTPENTTRNFVNNPVQNPVQDPVQNPVQKPEPEKSKRNRERQNPFQRQDPTDEELIQENKRRRENVQNRRENNPFTRVNEETTSGNESDNESNYSTENLQYA